MPAPAAKAVENNAHDDIQMLLVHIFEDTRHLTRVVRLRRGSLFLGLGL